MVDKIPLLDVEYLTNTHAAPSNKLIPLAQAAHHFFLKNNLYINATPYHTSIIDEKFCIYYDDLNDIGKQIAKTAFQKYLTKFDNDEKFTPSDTTILDRALKKLKKNNL